MRERVARMATAALLAALAGAAPAPARAQQSVADLIADCAPVPLDPVATLCRDGAILLAAERAGIGLAAAQGSAVPGSASTLGRRMASSPRIAFSLRGGTARTRYADPGDGNAPPAARATWPKSLEGTITVGLLEGWSLVPTVGGFLSLDALASIELVALSGGAGFEKSIQGFGYGARVGLFRESFTLPGVSVSAVRRHLGEVAWGVPVNAPGVRVAYQPVVTSLRATVAKDLLSFGVLGGLGWDRYDGEASLLAIRPLLGVESRGSAEADDLTTDRPLVFGGLSYTLLILQLSAEGGWARGIEAPAGSGGFDAGKGSFFGSLAARVTY